MPDPVNLDGLKELTTEKSKEKRALLHVVDFMEKSRKFRRPYMERFEKLFEEYAAWKLKRRTALQRANLKVPYAFNIVETTTPQMAEAFLGERPYIKYGARGWEDVKIAEDLSEYISMQMDEMEFFNSFVQFLKNNSIYGTALAKTPWRVERRLGYTYNEEVDAQGVPKKTRKLAENTLFDGPDFQTIELRDFFPDPTATKPGDVQAMRGRVHRIFRTLDELKAKRRRKFPNGEISGIYENLDTLERGLKSKDTNAWVNAKNVRDTDWDQRHARTLGQDIKDKRVGKLEIWEYWGLFDFFGNGKLIECVIVVANGDTVIRCDINPYEGGLIPFVGTVNYPVPGEFYGIGDIEPNISLIKEGTALRNTRLDQANLAVNRMWKVDRNAGINGRSLFTRPNGIIYTDLMDGIQQLEAPEVTQSSYREIQQIDFDIQNNTANVNPSQGTSNLGRAFGQTARGVEFLTSFADNRVKLKARMIEELVIKRFADTLLKLNKQFSNEAKWFRVQGSPSPFRFLPRDAFHRKYDFIGSGVIDKLSKGQRQQIFMNVVLPLLQTVEGAQPGTMKMSEAIPFILKEFDVQDAIKIINSPQEQAQIAQNRFSQQLASVKGEKDMETESRIKVEAAKALFKRETELAMQMVKGEQTIEQQDNKSERDAENMEIQQIMQLMGGLGGGGNGSAEQ